MTPLDMATCAAVAWAGLATVGAGGVYALMRRENRDLDDKGYAQFVRAQEAEAELTAAEANAEMWVGAYERQVERTRALMGAEDRLRKIESQRDAANKRWSRAMHLLRTAEKQNRALVDAQLAGVA